MLIKAQATAKKNGLRLGSLLKGLLKALPLFSMLGAGYGPLLFAKHWPRLLLMTLAAFRASIAKHISVDCIQGIVFRNKSRETFSKLQAMTRMMNIFQQIAVEDTTRASIFHVTCSAQGKTLAQGWHKGIWWLRLAMGSHLWGSCFVS